MASEDIELNAVLKLDTSDAESKLASLQQKGSVSLSKEDASSVSKATEDLADSVKKPLSKDKGFFASLGKLAKGAMSGFRGLGKSLTDVIGKTPKVAGIITLIIALISAIVKMFAKSDSFKRLADSVKYLLKMVRIILKPLMQFVAELAVVVDELLTALKPLFEFIGNFLYITLKPLAVLLKALSPVFQFIGKILEGIATALKPLMDLLDTIQEFILNIFGLTQEGAYSTTGEDTGDFKSSLDAWETTTEATADEPTAGESEIIEAINTETAVLAEGQARTQAIVSAVTNVFEGFFNVIASVLNGIATAITAIFGIVGATLDAVATAIRWIADAVRALMDLINAVIIGPINWVLDKIKSVEIFGWKPFDWIQLIPLLAKGGEIGSQVWGMNEKGNPEFIFNNGGTDTVINKEILSDALYQALVKAGTGSRDIEVSVKEGAPAGPRELVNWILPSLKFALK